MQLNRLAITRINARLLPTILADIAVSRDVPISEDLLDEL
jgi:hypothetical protein